MRTVTSETITRTVKNLCLRANKFLPSDIKLTLDTALDYEISPNGKRAIHSIIENYKMSQHTSLPICQDTGMVVVFAEIGQDVHIVGELFEDAVNEGVRQAYRDGNLRKSVVNDPLNRQNSEDNTPAIIHVRLVPGNSITLTVIPQGAGSENASSLKMFRPSATREEIISYVVNCVQENKDRFTTLGELGYYDQWLGSSRCIAASAGVSDDVIAFYEAAFKAAMEDPDYLEAASSFMTDYKDAADTAALIEQQQTFTEGLDDAFWGN